MHNKLSTLLVISLMFAVGFISFAPRYVEAKHNPLDLDMNGPWSGWYGESIYFEGSASGGTPPYTFDWDMDDGTLYYNDQDFYHTYYPDWESPKEYTVEMKVTDDDEHVAWAWEDATISISFDISPNADCNRIGYDSEPFIIEIQAANQEGSHICPEGYIVETKIFRGIINPVEITTLAECIGPNDLAGGDWSDVLITEWTNPEVSILPYRARVTATTLYDSNPSDNTRWSNYFYIFDD